HMLSSGTRLCTPASTFDPGSAARGSSACWKPCGRTNEKGAGFTSLLVGLRTMAGTVSLVGLVTMGRRLGRVVRSSAAPPVDEVEVDDHQDGAEGDPAEREVLC